MVAEPGAGSVTLLVTRPSGLSASSVQCRPIPLTAVPMIYGEEATAARPNVDYIFSEAQTLSFSVGQVRTGNSRHLAFMKLLQLGTSIDYTFRIFISPFTCY